MASKKKKAASRPMDELTRIHLQSLRHRLVQAKAKLRDKKLTGSQHDAVYKNARELRTEVTRIESRFGGSKKKARKGKRK